MNAAIPTLADHLCQGRAVFFVGSGFSIDPENTHVGRLIERLQIRLAQMEDVLGTKCKFQQDLARKFGAGKIADNYFEANSWFCATFGQLLEQASQANPEVQQLLTDSCPVKSPEIIAAIDPDLLKPCDDHNEWRERGKALVLGYDRVSLRGRFRGQAASGMLARGDGVVSGRSDHGPAPGAGALGAGGFGSRRC